MLFEEPPRTAYDLNFTLLGTPVRVHPFFWLIMLLLGSSADTTAQEALVWLVAAFVSILVHEFGHVLAINYYGSPAHIVLHGFGGLAIQDSNWRRDPKSQIVISLAGPAAGFLLAGVILIGLKLGGQLAFLRLGMPNIVNFQFYSFGKPYVDLLIGDLLYANIYWGLLNLLPIYPLDGGQTAASVFQIYDYRDGLRKALMLSIGTAVLIGVYGLTQGWQFSLFFFGYLAYQNYMTLQQLDGRYPGSRY